MGYCKKNFRDTSNVGNYQKVLTKVRNASYTEPKKKKTSGVWSPPGLFPDFSNIRKMLTLMETV